jgi:long-chain acyl-CoA synthetase
MPEPAARSLLLGRLAQHAAERPGAIAVCEVGGGGGRTLTWRTLHAAAGALAARLRARSDRPVLAVLAPNRGEMLVALLAGLWSDGAAVPLATRLPRLALVDLLRRTAATALVADEATLSSVDDVAGLDRIPLDALAAGAGASAPPPIGAGGSLLLGTTGTTGPPKLARRASPALDAVGAGCAARIGIGAADRMLIAIPLHHSYGIDQGMLAATIGGACVELHDEFSPARVLASLRERAVTILPAVPYMLDVLARSAHAGAPPSPALRRVISAGGALPDAVRREFVSRFGVGVGQIYGATEFGSATWSDPDVDDGGVGRALPGVELRIVAADANDAARPLAAGAEGQVAVAGATLLSGYLGEPEPATRDGFFLTGDLGRLDADGRLSITGRLSLLVDVGGRKVNPLEVESVLESHPKIAAAAVVPIPYSRTVGRLKAIVVPKHGDEPDARELRAFLRERLAAHKIPRSFETRAALPRSATGKLLRQQLVARDSGQDG